jgi:putative colanic acid biosynthesis UDP-glucose lipid carrier transferase
MNQFDTLACSVSETRPAPVSPRVARSAVKRSLDLTIASAALVFLAPLLALVALAIWLEDQNPVLFRQQRTGLYGRAFRIYKFRTMTVAEDDREVRQAVKGDQRVTRVGAVLRALSLDELPQLVNVIKGDMSIVGPRPHALAHDEAWKAVAPGYSARFRTRPGLTGYAQVKGYRGEVRTNQDIVQRIEADNQYIEGWSIRLEIEILLRTIPLVFHDPRAY